MASQTPIANGTAVPVSKDSEFTSTKQATITSEPVLNGTAAATNNSAVPGATEGKNGGGYVSYSGPASHFPSPHDWARYEVLWSSNKRLLALHDTPSEIRQIKSSIESVARSAGVDVRVILCVIVQESGGNVRVPTTTSPGGIRNPGLMQSHNGAAFDPAHPGASILQMVRDGVEGTRDGDGLKACYKKHGENWYKAFRAYNSGSVNDKDLSDGLGATGKYVSDVANRLMGHVWNGM